MAKDFGVCGGRDLCVLAKCAGPLDSGLGSGGSPAKAARASAASGPVIPSKEPRSALMWARRGAGIGRGFPTERIGAASIHDFGNTPLGHEL